MKKKIKVVLISATLLVCVLALKANNAKNSSLVLMSNIEALQMDRETVSNTFYITCSPISVYTCMVMCRNCGTKWEGIGIYGVGEAHGICPHCYAAFD